MKKYIIISLITLCSFTYLKSQSIALSNFNSGMYFSKKSNAKLDFIIGNTINYRNSQRYQTSPLAVNKKPYSVKKINYKKISNIKVYPNPATNIVHIELPQENLNEVENISIFSILGTKVYSSSNNIFNNNKLSINLRNIKQGRYFIQIKFSNPSVRALNLNLVKQ